METQTEKHENLKKVLRKEFSFARIKNYSTTTIGIYPKNKETHLFTLEEIESIYTYLLENNHKANISTIKEDCLNEVAGNGKRLILNLYADGIKGVF